MSNEEKVSLLSSSSSNPTYMNARSSTGFNGTYDVEKSGGSSQEMPPRIRRLTSSTGETIEPITLSWRDINVYADTQSKGICSKFRSKEKPSEKKQILKNVNGLVRPGTLIAIIGASGAGKSTLMNVLTSRNIGKIHVSGVVRVNGIVTGRNIKNISGYVQQDDMFYETLTVREHLVFRALLRMDRRISKTGRMQRVEEVIEELGLEKCVNTAIGYPGFKKGISGGEKKRLSFASEILTNPPLLFCDEATSGLDSFMAQSVVQTLKTLVMNGRTILCTIHQPSSEVYAMFDQLLIMAEGRLAYMGPTKEALPFFNSHGFLCPMNFNPADYFISTLAIVPGRIQECKDRVEVICDAFNKSDRSQIMKADEDKLAFGHANYTTGPLVILTLNIVQWYRYGASWCRQLGTVLWRTWITGMRDPMVVRIRTIQTIIIGVMLGLVYLQQDYTQEGVMNINGALFLFLNFMTFNSLFATINVFPQELPVFLREHGSGIYRTDIYFISKTLCDIPTYVLLPVIFTSITYWMIGLYSNGVNFMITAGILVLVANTAVSLGYMVSTLASTVGMAMALVPPILLPLMLFGGFFLNNASVPDYFIWLEYLSWYKYANELLIVNQWKDVDSIVCDTPGGAPMGNASLPTNGTSGTRCFPNGNAVIQYMNFDSDNIYTDIGLICALFVGFRSLHSFSCW
ncbi:hypothetical protein ScPMuIL_016467 [Solemya velum]